MKQQKTTARIKDLLSRVTFSIATLIMLTAGPVAAQNAPSYSGLDLHAIDNNTSHYDPTTRCDAPSTGITSSGLPASIPPAWRDVLNKAAAAKNTSVQLLASIYLTENGNVWHDFDHAWDNAGAAKGPFQFLPGTWDGHKQDGNGDGVMDVNNVWDAAFAAADMIAGLKAAPSTPLGTLQQPMQRGTLLYIAASYNHGPGWAQQTSDTASLDSLPQEPKEYVMNVYALISSGFTKHGKPAYGDPRSDMKNPGTDTSGAATNTTGGTDPNTSGGGNQCCGTTSSGRVVVIDPGHSGQTNTVIDPQTNLKDYDYPNVPEITDVFDVAGLVQAQLQKDGYKVIMTKTKANDVVTFRQRADIANSNHADIAISIHDQGGSDGGLPFASANNLVYPQRVGLYRVAENGKKISYSNAQTATLSQQYADIFKAARASAEGHDITVKQDAGELGGRGLAAGNMWMVQLFSDVPWVYNEAGGNSAGQSGLSLADKQKYAKGLIDSIEKAVPVKSTNGNSCLAAGGASGGAAAVVAQALNLAWDNGGHSKFRANAKTIYADTEDKLLGFKSDAYPDEAYSDCGVFVATVMRSSGADPNYAKRNTVDQLAYLLKNSTGATSKYIQIKTHNTGDLHPGDIFVFGTYPGGPGHTYIYTGTKNGNSRSASFHSHVPENAGDAYWTQEGNTFSIFRLR